jgi:hypothetical protein
MKVRSLDIPIEEYFMERITKVHWENMRVE